MAETFADVALQLYECGYEPLPSSVDKVPCIGYEWQKVPIDDLVVDTWVNGFGDRNASVRLGQEINEGQFLAFLDVDVYDKEVSTNLLHFIKTRLGRNIMVRVGNAPKFGILVLAESIDHKEESDLYTSDGKRHKLELLNRGQQVLLYGTARKVSKAPDSGTFTYRWNAAGRELLKRNVKDLPVLTQHDWTYIKDEFYKLARAKKWQTKRSAKRSLERDIVAGRSSPGEMEESAVAFLEHYKQPTASLADLETLLKHIPPDVPNDTWFRCLAAIHFEAGGSEEGFKLADKWSSGAFLGHPPVNYLGTEDVRTRYYSFKDTPTRDRATVGTLRALAKEYGYLPAPKVEYASGLEAEDQIEVIATTEDITEDLPPMLKAVCRYYIDSCVDLYSPIMAVMTALHLVAFCTQRCYAASRLNVVTRSNFYHLQVMPSGAGKATAPKVLSSLLQDLMPYERAGGIVQDIGSAEGFKEHLAHNPNMLWVQDEIADLLMAHSAGKTWDVRRTLKEFYSKSGEWFQGRKLAVSRGRTPLPDIYGPHLSVIGSTTPELISRAITGTDSVDGFLNRFMPVYAAVEDLVSLPLNVKRPTETPPEVRDWFSDLDNFLNFGVKEASVEQPVMIKLHEDLAHDAKMMRERSVRIGGIEGAMRARQSENTTKVALCYQLALDPESQWIQAEAWHWAKRYVNQSIITMKMLLSKSISTDSIDLDDKDVMEYVRSTVESPQMIAKNPAYAAAKQYLSVGLVPDWVLKTHVAKTVKLHRELSHSVETLIEAGRIAALTRTTLETEFGIKRSNRAQKTLYFFDPLKKKEIFTALKSAGEK
jgi:hypothetical protein